MASTEFSEWPEADISAILRLHGIEPCKNTYETIATGKRSFFLLSKGVCASYETRDLGTARGKDSVTNFKAIVVNEGKEKRGAGIYYEVVEGGNGSGVLICGKSYWDDPNSPKDGIGIIGLLSGLKKK